MRGFGISSSGENEILGGWVGGCIVGLGGGRAAVVCEFCWFLCGFLML